MSGNPSLHRVLFVVVVVAVVVVVMNELTRPSTSYIKVYL